MGHRSDQAITNMTLICLFMVWFLKFKVLLKCTWSNRTWINSSLLDTKSWYINISINDPSSNNTNKGCISYFYTQSHTFSWLYAHSDIFSTFYTESRTCSFWRIQSPHSEPYFKKPQNNTPCFESAFCHKHTGNLIVIGVGPKPCLRKTLVTSWAVKKYNV